LSVLAKNVNRPRDPDGHLRYAGKVLDIAGQDRRIERVLSEMR
jgi:hypothetical protein